MSTIQSKNAGDFDFLVLSTFLFGGNTGDAFFDGYNTFKEYILDTLYSEAELVSVCEALIDGIEDKNPFNEDFYIESHGVRYSKSALKDILRNNKSWLNVFYLKVRQLAAEKI